ncbi:uncharacterized protein LOC120110881 [Phoenix dactylifera]|uniref:Uncharacterized protein LOC103710316 n=1 Tax=Phoenix dactylifera TaxID=42345 RepID=A0A8B9AAJ4_PHODC|nr:uncharacterized protein LOC103710316 [Phoenix dactylifera]XP_038982742.1 uncharacterized protein LOC120110881 [Phoenix dactylifera]
MAFSYTSKAFIAIILALNLLVPQVLGAVTCERLDRSTCAFAVSSAGTRCVLEKRVRRGGQEEYTCRASRIEADGLKDHVETDECLEACGLGRDTLGISSDSLLDSRFTQKLCSARCFNGCPNIVNLYFNLAAGEGVFLPKLCETHRTSNRRTMAEIRSSGEVMPTYGPEAATSNKLLAYAPTQSSDILLSSSAKAPSMV